MKRKGLFLAILLVIAVCMVTLCACNNQPADKKSEKKSVTICYWIDDELYAQSKIVDGIIQDDVEDPKQEGSYFNGWLLDREDATSTLASKSIQDLIAITDEILADGGKYLYVYASFVSGNNVSGVGLIAFNCSKHESISSVEMNGTLFTFVQKYTYNINNIKEDFSLEGRFKISPTATYETYEKLTSGEFVKSSLDVHLEYEYASATRFLLVSCYDDYKGETDHALYEFIVIRGFEKDSNATFTASDYFATLWKSTTALGQDVIDTNGFVKTAIDFSLELNEVEAKTKVANQSIAVGFHVEMVVNCKDEDLNGTSVKVQIYDPAHNNNENILTAYYFVDTPGYYYFDGDDGRHVKFKIQNGLENNLASMLYDLLNDPEVLADFLYEYSDFLLIDMDSGENSIMDILLDMARTMGPGWDFNDAFESFCKSFNFDAYKELSRYSGMISAFLGITEDELFDENGVLQLNVLLCSNLMNNLFLASAYEHDGIVTYQAKLNPIIITALTSPTFEKMFKVKNIGKVFGYNMVAMISYDINNGRFDGIDFEFGLGDVIATVDGIRKYAQIKLCFNDISVSTASAGETVSMPIAKEDYSTDVVFNLDIKGTTENIKGVYDNKIYDLTGEFDTSATFRLDTENFGLTDNKTQLYTYMSYNDEKFAEISLNKGKLALTIDRSVVVKTAQGEEAPIIEVLASMVGDNMQQFFDSLLIDVDNTKHRDDKEHREVIYRTILSIIDPSFMNAVYDSAFNKNPDGTYNFSDMKDDFVGIVFNNFDCQQLLVKMTKAYMEKNDLSSDDIDVLQEKIWQSKTISHVVADSSSMLDAFDMENVAKAIRSVMPVIHTENDRLKVQTYQFETFIDSIVCMFKEGYTIVGKITANNKYRDLEYFASNIVIGDGEARELNDEGFYDFLKLVFSTDVMAMLDFNGLATDNAVEIQVGFESPDEYSMFVDLTMNLTEYKASDFVDVMDKANAGDFVKYKLVIYDEAQDCDDFVRSQYTYQGVSYEELKAQDMEDWREEQEKNKD